MVKIVGKFLFCIFSSIVIFIDARVSMEVRTEGGANNQVIVGQPFVLDVVIEDVYGSVQAPKIKGLDGLGNSFVGMYSSSINGKSSARYSYQVRIDTLGSYLLGPAVVSHKQQEFISNQVRVNVVKDLGVAAQKNTGNARVESKAFLRLMVDAESVVVGQKMSCILRFYYQDTSLSLHNIGIPELPGFDIKEVGKLESGTAEIDGSEYRYAQWQWDMYPTKPGEFIIPAYNADYDIPVKDNNNHLLGGLFMFINNRVDRKRVYSNALTVKVLPLPHCDRQVHAVGCFERISAEIKPGIAKEGEGMVLVIEVEGIGNLQAIAVPKLKLPESLKYYDSTNTIILPKHADELPKKRFEFIVQGMRCGECEIPEQLFTYFDVERNTYATLRTSPLAVSIKPGATSSKKIETTTSAAQAPQVLDEDIADINTAGQWYPVDQRKSLPWWLFQMLFLMPCLYICYPAVADKCIVLTGNSFRFIRRRAFSQARKKIKESLEYGNSKILYATFVTLFQQLEQVVGVHSVEDMLRTRKASEELVEQWKVFFERITHVAYAHTNNEDTEQLCRMAKQWLERLEKII